MNGATTIEELEDHTILDPLDPLDVAGVTVRPRHGGRPGNPRVAAHTAIAYSAVTTEASFARLRTLAGYCRGLPQLRAIAIIATPEAACRVRGLFEAVLHDRLLDRDIDDPSGCGQDVERLVVVRHDGHFAFRCSSIDVPRLAVWWATLDTRAST